MSSIEIVELPAAPDDAVAALRAGDGDETALRQIVTGHPTFVEAWAALSEVAYASGDDVSAYAFARAGYHRGLDQMRGAGWRGAQSVPFTVESNRGMLRALNALMRAAASIGEGVEARRCREFLLQLDPADHYQVADIKPAALSRRLEA